MLRNTSFLCYKSDMDFRPLLCLPVGEDGYDVINRSRSDKSGKQVTHELQFYKSAAETYIFSADAADLAGRWLQVGPIAYS